MAIGTSLGAYFEDTFHHQAGIETPPEVVKPGDTGDDNVVPPDPKANPVKEDKEAQVIPVADIKTSNPNITITDEDIDKGMSLGMGFAGGGFHATLEGLGLLGRLGGKVSTSGDGLPATVHLQGEAHDAVQEGPDAFQQFMATRGRSQPSNIVDAPAESPPAPASPVDPTVRLPGENSTDHALRIISRALDNQTGDLTEADLVQDHDPLEAARGYVTRAQQRIAETKDLVNNATDKATRGSITIAKDPELEALSYGNRHRYNFLSEGGQPGELTLTERQNGRELHVNWIGAIGKPGPMDVGKSEMKNLFFLLADRYPNAEKITGFRVSGARAAQGRIGDAEMRIPGRRAAPVNQEYGDDPDLLTRGQ